MSVTRKLLGMLPKLSPEAIAIIAALVMVGLSALVELARWLAQP